MHVGYIMIYAFAKLFYVIVPVLFHMYWFIWINKYSSYYYVAPCDFIEFILFTPNSIENRNWHRNLHRNRFVGIITVEDNLIRAIFITLSRYMYTFLPIQHHKNVYLQESNVNSMFLQDPVILQKQGNVNNILKILFLLMSFYCNLFIFIILTLINL